MSQTIEPSRHGMVREWRLPVVIILTRGCPLPFINYLGITYRSDRENSVEALTSGRLNRFETDAPERIPTEEWAISLSLGRERLPTSRNLA